MQSVHVTAYAVRTLRGHYVKTGNDEGTGYALFNTRSAAKEWVEEQGKENCFVIRVRVAITPTDTGRTERMVAVRQARSEALSAKRKVEHNFYP